MSTFEKISPDDPRLTAYALGEMEPEERAAFEQLLKQDAAAYALVAGISGTARHIGAALADEPLPEAAPPPVAERYPAEKNRGGAGQLLRFPHLYFTISTLAAACFVVAFLVWGGAENRREDIHYTEIDLSKIGPASSLVGLADGSVDTSTPSAGLVDPSGEGGNFVSAQSAPLSTFAPVVDTAAYAEARKQLTRGGRPALGLVQIEAWVNYFPYRYAAPDQVEFQNPKDQVPVSEDRAFAAHLEVANAPWAPEHRLVRIGLKGRMRTEGGKDAPTIARDMSVQVAFNPEQVLAYRLIGYENRTAPAGQTSADPVVAAAIRSGHSVTALYEIVPSGNAAKMTTPAQDKPEVALSDELLTVRLRYRLPEEETSRLAEFPLRDGGRTFEQASADFKFAASVAAFGMILRESPHKGSATFSNVSSWAQAGLVDDTGGYRSEFVGLVNEAARMARN